MAINDDKKDYYHTDIDYLDLSDAVSAHECTGLIPEGESPADKDEKYKKSMHSERRLSAQINVKHRKQTAG